MRGGLTLSEYKFDEYDKILLNLVCRGVCKFYQAGTHEKNWGKYQCGAYLGLKKNAQRGENNRKRTRRINQHHP